MNPQKKALFFPWLRVKMVENLSRLLLGEMAGAVPRSIVGDILEVVDCKKYTGLLQVARLVDDACVESYGFPVSFPHRFPQKKAYHPKHIYSVKDAPISSRSGLVMASGGDKAFLQSVGSLNRLLGWGNILPEMLAVSTATPRILGDVIVCPDTGYFHWLLEVMPNVIHCLNYLDDKAKIVIPMHPPSYIEGALRHLLGSGYEDRVVQIRLIARAEMVYFATFESRSGYVRKSDTDVLRHAFASQIALPSRRHKIYISRAKSFKRSIANEKEVEEALKSQGFKIVYAEELSFMEQIKFYSSATEIVAPHGAGLANIVWCHEGTRVLEIFPYNNLHFCYATLASGNRMQYSYLECKQDAQSHGRVDVDKLISMLERV